MKFSSEDLWRTAASLRVPMLGFLIIAVLVVMASFPGAAEDPNPASINSTRGAWPLFRQWTVPETQHFAQWIEHIYTKKTQGTPEQRLAKLEHVLTDPEMNLLLDPEFGGDPLNPQLDTDTMRSLHSVLDCAKLTVALTTYYAYRRGLPWMVSSVRSGDGTDIRTAAYTVPAGGMSVLDYDSPHGFFSDAVTALCTGNFRVEPDRDGSERSDTVPVAIDRRYLMPGCLYYLDGHVLVLAMIDKFGEPHFLDSTTVPTRDIYTHNGFNAVTGLTPSSVSGGGNTYAGCYRGFRVQRYPIAEVDDSGTVLRVRRRTDAEMAEFGYSTEQYDKLRELVDRRAIAEAGLSLDSFHEFVRFRLRTVEQIDPAQELKEYAARAVEVLQERAQLVDKACADVRENGPIEFPEGMDHKNIFNAQGRWGAGATALLDTEFRYEYFDVIGRLGMALAWFNLDPKLVNLEGLNKHAIWGAADLAFAVMKEKDRVFADSAFSYTNSAGEPVRLSLLDVERRLYDLSFDPNHPPELRWGAPLDSAEAQTASDMATPLANGSSIPMVEAYRREAYYRTLNQREPDQSYLGKMFTEGFPIRTKLEEEFRPRCVAGSSPPLVPHNGKLAWLAEQATMQRG